jgi:hypothetical protein
VNSDFVNDTDCLPVVLLDSIFGSNFTLPPSIIVANSIIAVRKESAMAK